MILTVVEKLSGDVLRRSPERVVVDLVGRRISPPWVVGEERRRGGSEGENERVRGSG